MQLRCWACIGQNRWRLQGVGLPLITAARVALWLVCAVSCTFTAPCVSRYLVPVSFTDFFVLAFSALALGSAGQQRRLLPAFSNSAHPAVYFTDHHAVKSRRCSADRDFERFGSSHRNCCPIRRAFGFSNNHQHCRW